jgi:hypothetical protein
MDPSVIVFPHFHADPPEDAFDKIARRLYPDDPGKIFTFIVHMTHAVYSSWCYPFNLPDVNLALEGSDVDVLRWLRAHIDYGTVSRAASLQFREEEATPCLAHLLNNHERIALP